MLRKLYMVFGVGVIGFYAFASMMGWELANSSDKPGRMGTPFFYTSFRGGK
jgi:hypothetical protein